MIIRAIHIENFGCFHDFTLELVPGLNFIRGGNEFGKSTLLEFVRRVLWGFPDGRKQQLNRYPAFVNQGEYGGWLDAELADGRRVRLERLGVRGRLVVRYPDGGSEDGEAWLGRITPISGDCYRNVYAVTTDELSKLANLESDEIRGRLYGGAITGEGVSLPDLGKLLDERAKAAYKQHNGASRINTARQKFRAACDELAEAVNRGVRRSEVEAELARVAEEERKLREDKTRLGAEADELKLKLRAHPLAQRKRELEAALAELPPSPEITESEATQVSALALSLEKLKNALPPKFPESENGRLEQELAETEAELARFGAAPSPLPGAEDHAAARELEREWAVLAAALPLGSAVAAVFGGGFILAAGIALQDLSSSVVPSAVVAALILCGVFAAKWRKNLRRRAMWEQKRAAFASRLGLDASPGAELAAPLLLREQRARLEAALRERHESASAHAEFAKVRAELDAACRRFGADGAEAVRELAARSAKRRQLQMELKHHAARIAELSGAAEPSLDGFDPEAAKRRVAELDSKLEELERGVFLLHRQSGALANELAHLPDDGELELRRSLVESARGEIADAVREFLTVRACRRLLDAAVARYERESQPAVLRRAAELFANFTGGRYPRLYRNLGSGELIACDLASGREKNFQALSRGTREELMIAMRLALIEHTEKDSEVLPVIFDDVGVNFDETRKAQVESATAEFAEGRQVIWFSHS